MGLFFKTPCTASITDMRENGAGWHCGACNKTVRDLRHATEEQVEQWLEEGPVCGRGLADSTGRLLLAGALAAMAVGPALADNGTKMPSRDEVEAAGETCTDGAGGADGATAPADATGDSSTAPVDPAAGEDWTDIDVGEIWMGGIGTVKPGKQRRASRRAERKERREARREARQADAEPEEAE